MTQRRFSGWLSPFMLFCLCFFVAQSASAHLMPAEKGTLNLIDNKAYLVLSLPMSSLGLASEALDFGRSEKDQEVMRRALKRRLNLSSPQGPASFERILFNLGDSESASSSPAGHKHELVVMIVARFSKVPKHLTLHSTLLLGAGQLQIKGTISAAKKTLQTDLAILSAAESEVHFFSGPQLAVQRSASRGFFHLLFGFDHLVFFLLFFLLVPHSLRIFVSIYLGLLTAALLAFALQITTPLLELLVALSILISALSTWKLKPKLRLLTAIAFLGALIHGIAFTQTNMTHISQGSSTWFQALGLHIGLSCALLLLALTAFSLKRMLGPRFNKLQQLRLQQGVLIFASACSLYWISLRSLLLAGLVS